MIWSYTLNSQTAVFLGYNGSYLGGCDYDLTVHDRTLFAKIGYAPGI